MPESSPGWGNPRAVELRERLDHIKALAVVAAHEARELRTWIDGEVSDSVFTARLPWLEAQGLANGFGALARDCDSIIDEFIDSPWANPDGYTHVIERAKIMQNAIELTLDASLGEADPTWRCTTHNQLARRCQALGVVDPEVCRWVVPAVEPSE